MDQSRITSPPHGVVRRNGGFFAGAGYPFFALGLLARTPRLWQFIVVPLIVNIVVGVTLYAGLLFLGWRSIDQLVAGMTEWGALLAALLRALLIIGLLLGTGFVLVRFGVVLGSPWYSRLSAELERIRTGYTLPEEPFNIVFILRDLGRALAFELKKLLLVIAIGLPTLLLNFVPVAGQLLATVASVSLGATVACLDFFDSSLERRRLGFRHKLRLIRRSLPGSAGFGLMSFALVSIPLVNLLTIPICVAAGTLFVCDHVLPELEQ